MKIKDAYPVKYAAEQERERREAALSPQFSPRLGLCGPETITSTVRDLSANTDSIYWVTLWDDPMQRACRCNDIQYKQFEAAYFA